MNNKVANNSLFIKTVLMLLVVLGHACAFWTGNWFTKNPIYTSKGLAIISQWLSSFHTYTFTIIAGYIFQYKIDKGDYRYYMPFLKKKAMRLLVPYMFSMIIWVAPITAYFLHYNIKDLIEKFVYCISPAQLWFLWMLFGVFAIVWPLRKHIAKNVKNAYIIGVLFYIIGIFGSKAVPNFFCIWTSCQYMLFFVIGMRIREKERTGKECWIFRIPWYIWVLFHIVVFYVSLQPQKITSLFPNYITFILSFISNIVGSCTALVVLNGLARSVSWRDKPFFKRIASLSFPVYLFHQQIIYFVIHALNGKINPWLHMTMNFLVALCCASLISLLLEKWKVTKKLIGEQ